MAGLDDINVGEYATQIADSMSGLAYPVVWSVLALVIIFSVLWFLQHRHRVIIRVLHSGGNGVPTSDRAREVKVDGVVHWKLLKRRHVIPVPPPETLTPLPGNGKPKFRVEMSWSEHTGYVPLVYDVTSTNFLERVRVDEHGKVLLNAFQPFTPQQRSLLVNQAMKAALHRKKNTLDAIAQLATPLILAMVFIAVLLFWEDVARPAKEIAAMNAAAQEKNAEILQHISTITNQLARVSNELTGSNLPVEQRPSPEAG